MIIMVSNQTHLLRSLLLKKAHVIIVILVQNTIQYNKHSTYCILYTSTVPLEHVPHDRICSDHTHCVQALGSKHSWLGYWSEEKDNINRQASVKSGTEWMFWHKFRGSYNTIYIKSHAKPTSRSTHLRGALSNNIRTCICGINIYKNDILVEIDRNMSAGFIYYFYILTALAQHPVNVKGIMYESYIA